MTFNGPNESLLKRFSLESGCMVEWYFHSFWLHGALALMFFIIVNVQARYTQYSPYIILCQ